MSVRKVRGLLWAACAMLGCAVVGTAGAQGVNDQHGVISFTEPTLADPFLQHSREVYVLYGCAYCHGTDLRVRNGEAADLLHSALVGADESGSLVIPLLKAGIPQTPKLSPMPQFSDLSQGELAAIVRWIHYARQQERYKEVVAALPAARADAAAGKARFAADCSSCHEATGKLAPALRGATPQAIETRLLRPAFLEAPAPRAGGEGNPARARHLALLENATAQGVADIAAWLAGGSR